MPPTTVSVLPLQFTVRTQAQALAEALRLMATHRPAAIFTPNAEMAYRAARSPAFAGILSGADLLLPDGSGIVAAARLQGVRLPRLPGIDFAEALLACVGRPCRLFLLGGRPGVAAAAARVLRRRYPAVQVCGVQDGYFVPAMAHTVAATVRAARPDLLFVCLGSPRQEEWIAVHRPPCLAIGLGGALDVWAGEVRRAPRSVQRLGCEWLWRCLRQPARLRRLPALVGFSARVLHARRGQTD